VVERTKEDISKSYAYDPRKCNIMKVIDAMLSKISTE
jgi:hypothetical protein